MIITNLLYGLTQIMLTLFLTNQNNLNLRNKTEVCQYNVVLAITCAITGPLKETLYQKLGLEYLSLRRWLRKPCNFYKIFRIKSPGCVYQFILPNDPAYLSQTIIVSNKVFEYYNTLLILFFPTQLRSDQLGLEIHNSKSCSYIQSLAQIYKNDSDSVIIVTDSYGKVTHQITFRFQ